MLSELSEFFRPICRKDYVFNGNEFIKILEINELYKERVRNSLLSEGENFTNWLKTSINELEYFLNALKELHIDRRTEEAKNVKETFEQMMFRDKQIYCALHLLNEGSGIQELMIEALLRIKPNLYESDSGLKKLAEFHMDRNNLILKMKKDQPQTPTPQRTMNSKIPTESEVSFWFNETAKHPSFVETLKAYEKSKLFEYCQSQISSSFNDARNLFEAGNLHLFPKDLPEEKRLNFLITSHGWGNFAPSVNVLFALGFSWDSEKGIQPINKDQGATPEPKKESRPEKLTFSKKYNRVPLALLFVYNKEVLKDPRFDNSSKELILEGYKYNSDTSASQIFEIYNKLWNLRNEKSEQGKDEKKHLDYLGHSTMKKYIEEIYSDIKENRKKDAKSDLTYLENLLDLEEN